MLTFFFFFLKRRKKWQTSFSPCRATLQPYVKSGSEGLSRLLAPAATVIATRPPPPTHSSLVSPGRGRCGSPTGSSHSSHIKVLLSNSANGACSVKQSARRGGKESPTEITTAQFTQCEHPPTPRPTTPPLQSTGGHMSSQ